MKILITAFTYYPDKDGVSVVTTYLAEGLAKLGNKVTLVVKNNNNYSKKETHNGVNILRIDNIGFDKISLMQKGDKKGYIALIKKLCNQHDVMINVCTQIPTTDWLLNRLDEIEIPKVLYLHGIYDFKYRKNHFKSLLSIGYKIIKNIKMRFYYSCNKKNFKKYDIVTQLHEKDFGNEFFKKKIGIDSVIIENAADDAFFDSKIDKSIKLPEKYILNVSNYSSMKNQVRLLKIFLNSKISNDYELIFMGSEKNSYYNTLKSIYDDYKKNGGKKKVKLLTEIPRKDVSTYVKKAKLCVFTSNVEAFPITVCEAKAAGVPFLSTDVGIVKYLCGGQICNSDEDFQFWLNKLCNNDELREQLGKYGKTEADERLSIDNKVNQLFEILSNLVKNK